MQPRLAVEAANRGDLHLTIADGLEGHLRHLTQAIVSIGLAVATTHRLEDLCTDLRNLGACALDIESPAAPGLELAPEAAVARDRDDAATRLAWSDSQHARSRESEAKRRRECQSKTFHDFPRVDGA